MSGHGYCLELDIEDYSTALRLQQASMQPGERQHSGHGDFLEHQPCFTVGRKGGFEHILAGEELLRQQGIAVYETDREETSPIMVRASWYATLLSTSADTGVTFMPTPPAGKCNYFDAEAFRYYGRAQEGYPGVWVGQPRLRQKELLYSTG